MSDAGEVRIAPEPLESADARRLIAALDADISARYPDPAHNFVDLDAEEVTGDRGVFLVARVDGEAVGCGAARRHADIDGKRAAEIKRMFVAPTMRGRRLGPKILAALEAWGRSQGVELLVLETGPRLHEAVRVYERAGFTRIPRFGEYANAPESVCYGLMLGA